MTYKRAGVKAGKAVRRATGLALPLAMRAGKRIVRHDGMALVNNPAFEGLIEWERGCMDPQCDCKDRWFVKGPRGRFQIGGDRLWEQTW